MLAFLTAAGASLGLSSHFIHTVGTLSVGGLLLHFRWQQLRLAAVHRQELALRKEVLAYQLFNSSPRSMAVLDLGRQVSSLVAVSSFFARAAIMLRDETGSLSVAGSAGFDDLSVDALNRWGYGISSADLSMAEIATGHTRAGASSFTMTLDRRCRERNPLSIMGCKQVHMIPLRTASGVLGALVVCSRPRAAAKGPEALKRSDFPSIGAGLSLNDRLQPLEMLALGLTMQLTAPESVTPVCPARISPRQHRPTRVTGSRESQPQVMEERSRRNLDEIASSLSTLSTAAALERVRQSVDPTALPAERVAGVSGRPPVHVWRPGGSR